MRFVPNKIFFTKGVGRHKDKLQSFELALRDAKIAQFNLVTVSSIFPPKCKSVSVEKGLDEMGPGQIVFVVMSRNETDEAKRVISASIGLALPKDNTVHGYLSEDHAYGKTEKEAGDYAEDLAASMLASTLGIEFDPNTAYDERKDLYKMSGKIVRTKSVTQVATGTRDQWTSVVSAAVFVM